MWRMFPSVKNRRASMSWGVCRAQSTIDSLKFGMYSDRMSISCSPTLGPSVSQDPSFSFVGA